MIDRTLLERKTRGYWDHYNHKHPEPCLERYIENLLPDEMQYAQGILPDATCDLLVLLVGFSIEPLLQDVYAYRPQKVLLILNKRYGRRTPGADWGRMVERLIGKLPEPPKVVKSAVIQAGPQQVFQVLLRCVRQTEGVIVDITGAKKNMVAGAFLFAAFANVPVSYVDFDDKAYDHEWGKPYGYGCRIGILRNPYETFALRDWERVHELYRRYKFRDARRLLIGEDGKGEPSTILATMRKYLLDSEPAIQTLAKVLCCYELWDAGLYNEAADQARKIDDFQPPTAVILLDGEWFETEQARFKGGLSNFYEDTPEFHAYVYDELARIGRLIGFNHDYRSAFLRAGSLNEIVMTVRMVTLSQANERGEVLAKIEEKGIPRAEWLFEQLISGKPFKWHSIEFSPTKLMQKWWTQLAENLFNTEEGWRDFIHRRNDLIHQYFSPPPKWAQDALDFVRANVEDFWGPETEKTVNTEALHWSELCQLTGLEQYLTPNLTADESD